MSQELQKRFKYEPFIDETRSVNWQVERINVFLAALTATGEYSAACRQLKISQKTVRNYRRKHPWFQERCDDALGAMTDKLRDTALDRGMNGTPRYALGGRNRDERIQVGVDHSNELLSIALRRRDLTYGDEQGVHASGGLNLATSIDYSKWPENLRALLRPLLVALKAWNAEQESGQEGKA